MQPNLAQSTNCIASASCQVLHYDPLWLSEPIPNNNLSQPTFYCGGAANIWVDSTFQYQHMTLAATPP